MTPDLPPFSVAELDAAAAQVAAIPTSRLHAFDRETRSRSLTPPFALSGWSSLRPRSAIELASKSARPGAALALFAMHASGFVREAAIRALDRIDDELALPILMLRTADWVEQVRTSAVDAIERRRTRGPIGPWLALLPLLDHLAEEQSRGREFARGVRERVTAAAASEALIDLLRSADRPLRRAAARAIASKDANRDVLARALDGALEQDDPATARVISTALCRCASPTTGDLESLWSSRFSFVRALALPRIQERGGKFAEVASLAGLRDGSAIVRSTAREYLKHLGRNLAELHEGWLENDPLSALRGLVEIGAIREADRITPFLAHRRARVRAMAVKTLGHVAGREAEDRIVEFLDDESSRVAKTAARTLAPLWPGPPTLERAWQIAARHERPSAPRAAFLLFRSAGRFARLRMAGRAIVSPDPALREFGDALMRACLQAWNRESTTPDRFEIEELLSLVPELCARVPAETAKLIRLSLTPFLDLE